MTEVQNSYNMYFPNLEGLDKGEPQDLHELNKELGIIKICGFYVKNYCYQVVLQKSTRESQ